MQHLCYILEGILGNGDNFAGQCKTMGGTTFNPKPSTLKPNLGIHHRYSVIPKTLTLNPNHKR